MLLHAKLLQCGNAMKDVNNVFAWILTLIIQQKVNLAKSSEHIAVKSDFICLEIIDFIETV